MNVLIDMNLSPQRETLLREAGWTAVHWSRIGESNAPDHEILDWAKSNGHVIFTHDLDFGAILAATKADCPSVVQIRTQDVSPGHLKALVLDVLHRFQKHLEQGALISVDEKRSRVRLLPLLR
jgi:predicted nuclease of predicted toxin-antitoxin system